MDRRPVGSGSLDGDARKLFSAVDGGKFDPIVHAHREAARRGMIYDATRGEFIGITEFQERYGRTELLNRRFPCTDGKYLSFS